MRVHDYTIALIEILKEGKDTPNLLQDLMRVLKSRGHERLYPKILKDLEQTLTRHEKQRGVTITLASETAEGALRDELKKAAQSLGSDTYTTVIDPAIIGGFVAEGGEKRIDASYKKSLLALYRSLIA